MKMLWIYNDIVYKIEDVDNINQLVLLQDQEGEREIVHVDEVVKDFKFYKWEGENE